MSNNQYPFNTEHFRRHDIRAAYTTTPRAVPRVAPPICTIKHTARTAGSTILVIELPAKVQTVHVKNGRVRLRDYRLSMPNVIAMVEYSTWSGYTRYSNAWIYCRNTPLRTIDDDVCKTNFPNILFEEMLCIGDAESLNYDLTRCTNDQQRAEAFTRDFWERPFSDHSMTNFFMYGRTVPALHSFETWQAQSLRDPSFILRVPWQSLGRLRNLLNDKQGGFYR